MTSAARPLQLEIIGLQLPGRSCPSPDGGRYENVHVGVQRGKEVVDRVAGDAASAVWTIPLAVVSTREGVVAFRGPFVHGRGDERFVYLSWGTVDGEGAFAMFRRAKLRLDAIDGELLRALSHATLLRAELELTDRCGMPVCASVKPPAIRWSIPSG